MYSHKKHVVKDRKGVYRLKNNTIKTTKTKRSNKRKHRAETGITIVVKQIKDNNPQMTKNEVAKHLVESGFDFKEKDPFRSVNFAWTKLGYNEEGKQQPLPEVN